jgi:cobalt-zinc-cadmium efflux system protein
MPDEQNIDGKIKFGIGLNTSYMLVELAAGLWSGSLALISDAVHNLTDSLSLLISFIARKIARRQATDEHTYGYGKASIMAALINSIILIGLAGIIFYKAIQRISHPQTLNGGIIMAVAVAGIFVNGCIALTFRKHQDDLNIKSAYVNMAFDVLASLGTLLAGLVIFLTGKTLADPIVSMLIAVMLVFAAYGIVDKALHILLEGVPENIDFKKVEGAIAKERGVKFVDNLHIWSISSGNTALSCHIVIDEQDVAGSVEILERIKESIKTKFGIIHSTIEAGLTRVPPHEH